MIVKTAPTFVQDPAELYVTGNPEDAVAATVKLLPNTALPGAEVVTVMVWFAFEHWSYWSLAGQD